MRTATTLTTKQARFVDEYLVDGNGAGAAVRAGYGVAGSRVTACRTLANPNVRQAIDAGRRAYSEKLAITRADIVVNLLEAFELAKAQCQPMAMVRASAELARLLGLMVPAPIKVTVAAASQAENRLSRMTDSELLGIIEAGQAAATGA